MNYCLVWNKLYETEHDKYHLLISGRKHEHILTKIGQDIVWESNTVKLLGVTIDNHLKFGNYITNICSKASRELSALAQVANCSLFKKDVFFLLLSLSSNSNSVHLCGWFMGDKPIKDKQTTWKSFKNCSWYCYVIWRCVNYR